MSEKIKFFMSFRARLMLLLSSFLVLTIVLVLALDKWAQKRGTVGSALVGNTTEISHIESASGIRGHAHLTTFATSN
jgi:hypothetical protein